MSMAGMTEVSVIKAFLIGVIKVVRVRLLTREDKCRHNEHRVVPTYTDILVVGCISGYCALRGCHQSL